MDISLLIASISLAISLFLIYIEMERRWRKLHLSITSVDVIEVYDNQAFVIFYLSFVNRSTIPKSIHRLDSELLDDYKIIEVHGEPNSELTQREFRPFGSGCRGCSLRFDDITEFPLDVEPLHSRTVLIPVLISPVLPLHSDRSKRKMKLIGHFVAFDYRNKMLAKADIEIPI